MTDDELVAGVAHQVKTPIAVIRGYAELLAVRDDEATRREAADQIREAAEVLDFMVDDLIVAFALEAEVMPFEPAPVDVGRAADEVVARLSTRFGRHTFVTRFGGASPARADIEHLDRILATLVFNACRLSPDGGEVVIEGLDEDDVVKVSVSDSGPGLSEEERARVFARHRPSSAVERSELRSTGLELYKVRRLVELHGGAVTAESPPGGGSTFGFTLPRAVWGDSP